MCLLWASRIAVKGVDGSDLATVGGRSSGLALCRGRRRPRSTRAGCYGSAIVNRCFSTILLLLAILSSPPTLTRGHGPLFLSRLFANGTHGLVPGMILAGAVGTNPGIGHAILVSRQGLALVGEQGPLVATFAQNGGRTGGFVLGFVASSLFHKGQIGHNEPITRHGQRFAA